MLRLPIILACVGWLVLPCPAQVAAPTAANVGEAEAQKVEDRIAMVRRDILGKYETALNELQFQLQKAADLEGALAVRAERARLAMEQALSEKNYVNEPKSLRALQLSMVTKMHDLVAGVVADSLPKLIEYKKQLTVEGKLDDALAVKQAIERLQNANVPISRAEAGSIVAADALVQAYAADRIRADKTYKGVRIAARGTMSGYRIDPNDAKTLVVYLAPQTATGWVQCMFNLANWRYREDKIGAGTFLVLIARDGSEVRLGRGQQVDILGDCTGWDEMVKLVKCDVSR
jgi:hypothetical protein